MACRQLISLPLLLAILGVAWTLPTPSAKCAPRPESEELSQRATCPFSLQFKHLEWIGVEMEAEEAVLDPACQKDPACGDGYGKCIGVTNYVTVGEETEGVTVAFVCEKISPASQRMDEVPNIWED